MIPHDEARLQVIPPPPPATRPATPDPVDRILACIRAHESDEAGGYRAENPISTASGAYQFVDGTWREIASRSGHPDAPRHAADASPALQDAVARWAIEHGLAGAWRGTGCPRTE